MVTKLLRSRIFQGIVIILLITFIPNLPPYSKISEPISITPALPFEGKLALNKKLNDAEKLFTGELHGPEAFAVYNGELYTTLLSGDVVKIVGDSIIPVVKFGKPCKGLHEDYICGRPLGLVFDKNGILYVADAYYGIFKVDIKTGKYEQLVSTQQEIENLKSKIPNALTVASNGDVYWTDSSTDFLLRDGLLEMLSDGSGRLIHYDTKTKKNNVLLRNLHFANGVLLSKDETFVVVAETARNRLHRYYIKGPKKGTSDIFVDGLPGLPDNLQPDGQGGIFVTLAANADADNPQILQTLSRFPLIRRFIARIFGLIDQSFLLVNQIYPNEWSQKAIYYVGSFAPLWIVFPIPKRLTILRINEAGQIIESLHALDAKISGISDSIVFKDALYLGSPHNDFIARVPLKKAGLEHLAVKPESFKATPTPGTASPKTTASPPKTTASPPKTTASPPKTTTPPTTTPAPPKTKPTEKVKATTPPPSAKPVPTTQAPPVDKVSPTSQTKTKTQSPTAQVPTTQTPPSAKTPTTKLPPVDKTSTPSSTTNAPKDKPQATNTVKTDSVKPKAKEAETKNKESTEKK